MQLAKMVLTVLVVNSGQLRENARKIHNGWRSTVHVAALFVVSRI